MHPIIKKSLYIYMYPKTLILEVKEKKNFVSVCRIFVIVTITTKKKKKAKPLT